MRRNRQIDSAPEVERFDLGELAAQRRQAEAARSAEVRLAPVPMSGSTLAGYLDALSTRPLTRGRLPDAELAAKHDPELGRLLEAAQAAHSRAVRAAHEWSSHEPGSSGFAAELVDCDDEDELTQTITYRRARRWARAYIAQREALAADDRARTYALDAKRLRDSLDKLADEIADELGVLFERARDEKSDRFYEDAVSRAGEWRDAVALLRWCTRPSAPFTPLAGNAIPQSVGFRQYEAATALGRAGSIEVPLEAPDAPKRKSPRGVA